MSILSVHNESIIGRLSRKHQARTASGNMQTYVVEIVETLRRAVEVRAGSEDEAVELVRNGYDREDYVLDSGDFVGADFNAVNDRPYLGEVR